MYGYHYKYIKRKFDAKLLFTDTDILVCEIKTEKDVYEDFYTDKYLFDFSNYSKDSMFYDLTNKNEICKIKYEPKEKK